MRLLMAFFWAGVPCSMVSRISVVERRDQLVGDFELGLVGNRKV
jgi:hypothetical protein